MEIADCYLLGYVTRLHGYKGEVLLFLDVTDPSEYTDLKQVYLDFNGSLTPFFIEKKSFANATNLRIKFAGVESEDDARMLLKKSAYLPLTSLPQLSGTDFYDHEVIGFTICDKSFGEVGEIQTILDLPSNPLFEVLSKDGIEILIPIDKERIIQIDREKKEILIDAPEGLLDLYFE